MPESNAPREQSGLPTFDFDVNGFQDFQQPQLVRDKNGVLCTLKISPIRPEMQQAIEQIDAHFPDGRRDPIYLEKVKSSTAYDQDSLISRMYFDAKSDTERDVEHFDHIVRYAAYECREKNEGDIEQIIDSAAERLMSMPNSPKYNISPLMFAVGRWSVVQSSSCDHSANISCKIAQALLQKGRDPSDTDLFGRTAFSYVANGATLETSFPGRGAVLNMLVNADDDFHTKLTQSDSTGDSPLDTMRKKGGNGYIDPAHGYDFSVADDALSSEQIRDYIHSPYPANRMIMVRPTEGSQERPTLYMIEHGRHGAQCIKYELDRAAFDVDQILDQASTPQKNENLYTLKKDILTKLDHHPIGFKVPEKAITTFFPNSTGVIV